jgi:hypothetical protein
MAANKQASQKKTRKRSRTNGPKYMSILEEDFVLQFGPKKSQVIILKQSNSSCVICYENNQHDNMKFINCKMRGYKQHDQGRMRSVNKAVCKNCFQRIKKEPCPMCRGQCCKKYLKSRRYPKKKQCFAERMFHKARLRKRREKKIKKTILMDLVGIGFKQRMARDLISHCASEGIKLQLHLWRRRIDNIIYNQMY